MESQMPPLVSVIMPVRNEAPFIERSLGAVLTQDYPHERMEVIVADGNSDDGTREKLAEFAAKHNNLHVIDNPEKVVTPGFNAALDVAQGDIVIRVDGHSIVAQDFVRQNVEVMVEHPEAWCVGGPIIHYAHTPFGKAIAVAMSHPLGIGNALHRFANYEGYGEGVQFPAIRRWVFERIGKFEDVWPNEDDEFNYRMTQAGGKVYITPRIRYTYFVRERAQQLFRQYFNYGFWRIPVIKKHRQPTTVRQIVPSLFYLSCSVLLAVGLALAQPLIAFALPLIYFLALLLVALSVLSKVGSVVAVRVPFAIATLHAGYALGLIYGIWASVFQPASWKSASRKTIASR